MIEGEAEWITEQWRQRQSAEVRQALAEIRRADRAGDGVFPAVFLADTAAAYELGLRLYEAVHAADGTLGFDLLLNPGRLVNGSTLIDPVGRSSGAARSHTYISPVPAPIDAEPIVWIGDAFSGVRWFQILAASVPAELALDAARSIESTSQPGVWIDADGATCIAVDFEAQPESLALVDEAFASWVDTLPSHRTFSTADGATRQVLACDPGPAAVPAPLLDANAAIDVLVAVIDAELLAEATGWTLDEARCRAFAALAEPSETAVDLAPWEQQLESVEDDRCAVT